MGVDPKVATMRIIIGLVSPAITMIAPAAMIAYGIYSHNTAMIIGWCFSLSFSLSWLIIEIRRNYPLIKQSIELNMWFEPIMKSLAKTGVVMIAREGCGTPQKDCKVLPFPGKKGG